VRVLVVDDEFLIVSFVASMLEELGCEVEIASRGTEALAKLANDPRINVLITDVNMPDVSGVRRRRSRAADTAWAKGHLAIRCGDRGARAPAYSKTIRANRPHASDGGDDGTLL
jgi:hypothetical protein